MKFIALVLLLSAGCRGALAQQLPAAQTPPKQPAAPPTSPAPETQKIEATSSARTPQVPAGGPGYIEPAQFKALLHKIWLTEYRLNDLLSQVQPERWKISEAARQGFNQSLENLRKQLAALEEWRGQFEKRSESIYLGYQTYAAAGAVLPRLDGIARSITQYENPSLGAQYSQAENQLFDLQQALEPYLSFLLRSQDQVLLATQSNLAACQNELGYAMRGRAEAARPIRNVFTEFRGRRGAKRATETAPGPAGGKPLKRPESKAAGKKPEGAKGEKRAVSPASKPSAAPKSKASAPASNPTQKK
jgi:hypothetical protein